MNVKQTYDFFKKNDIVAVKANKSKSQDVADKLIELGNSQQAIPFYAVYVPGLERPITFAPGLLTPGMVQEYILEAMQDAENSETTVASSEANQVQ